jgi:hypothetical protein
MFKFPKQLIASYKWFCCSVQLCVCVCVRARACARARARVCVWERERMSAGFIWCRVANCCEHVNETEFHGRRIISLAVEWLSRISLLFCHYFCSIYVTVGVVTNSSPRWQQCEICFSQYCTVLPCRRKFLLDSSTSHHVPIPSKLMALLICAVQSRNVQVIKVRCFLRSSNLRIFPFKCQRPLR